MDWIVLVIFVAFFHFKSNIFRLFLYVVTEPLLYGAFKTIISLQFQAKSFFFFFFLSFSEVAQKVIFQVESKKYMNIMYKEYKIKHICDNVGEKLNT
jgi:hypothetical protein